MCKRIPNLLNDNNQLIAIINCFVGIVDLCEKQKLRGTESLFGLLQKG